MKKKILSIMLSVALVCSVVPMGMFSVSAEARTADYTHSYTDGSNGVKSANTTVYAYNRTGNQDADAQAILDGVTQDAEDLSPTYVNQENGTLTSKGYTYDSETSEYNESKSNLNERLTRVPKSGNTYYYPSLLTKATVGNITTPGDTPHIEDNETSSFAYYYEKSGNNITKQYGYSEGKAYYYNAAGGAKNYDIAGLEGTGKPYCYDEAVYNLTVSKLLTDIVVGRQYGINNASLATSNYKIYTSIDGKKYKEVYHYDIANFDNRSQGGPLFEIIHFNEPQKAQYIKLQILDSVNKNYFGTDYWNVGSRITTFKVFGYEYVSVRNQSTITQEPEGSKDDPSFYSLSEKAGAKNLHFIQYNKDGLPVTTKEDGTSLSFNDNTKKIIFDGAKNGDAQIYGDWKPEYDGTQWHTDIYYDFGAVCDVKEIVVSHHNTMAILRPDRYAVYASDNLYDLYSDENIVGYELNGNGVTEKISVQQNFIVTKPIEARYVGMRIWKPQPKDHSYGSYIRLFEFNAYGCTKSDAKYSLTAVDYDLRTGDSICPSATTVSYKESTDGGVTFTTDENLNKLYDNDTSTEYTTDSYFAEGSEVYIDGTTAAATQQRVVDIEYDLGESKDFNSIYVASESGVDALGRYVVYASKDKDTLYSDSNVIADYNNSEGYSTCSYNKCRQMFTLKNSVNARYVALRIIDPKTGHQNITDPSAYTATIQEFNLYKNDCLLSGGNTAGDYETDAQIEKSLIRGKKTTVGNYENKNLVSNSYPFSGRENRSYAVTDASVVTENIDLQGTNYKDDTAANKLFDNEAQQYQQINYELDGEANISKVAVLGHESNSKLRFSHIKLIFSDTLDGLNSTESNEEATVYDIYNDIYNSNSKAFSYIIATPYSQLKAKYFAVRIICGVQENVSYGASSCYGRIWHISVLGDYTNPVEATPTEVGEVVNGTVKEVIPNTDINGKYPAGGKATYTAAAAEGYKFVKWTDADGNYIAKDATYTYTLSSTPSPATVKPVYAATNDKVVKLTDTKSGEIIDILYNSDTYALKAALKEAAPKKFGYTVTGFNKDINDFDSVSPTYARDTKNANYKYEITAKDVDATVKTLENVYFDTRIIVTSESPAANIYWKNSGGSVIGVEKTVDFYACATDTVTAYEGEETAPAVTMLAATDTSNYGVFTAEKNSMTVFGKYDSDTAVKFGVAFTSKNNYDAAAEATDDEKWNNLCKSGKAKVVEFAANGTTKGYFMGTLEGITAPATRYAVCFVEYANGTRAYSSTTSMPFNS